MSEILKLRPVSSTMSNKYRRMFYDMDKISNINDPTIKEKYLNEICNYLDNPVKFGIWTLSIKWIDYGGITKQIISDLKIKINIEESLRIRFVHDFEKIEKLKKIREISFIFSLFRFLIITDSNKKFLESDFDKYDLSNYRKYLTKIKAKELRDKYKEAYEYFKENIYTPNMFTSVNNNILFFKKGIFIKPDSIEWESDKNRFRMSSKNINYLEYVTNVNFYSTNKESLEFLNNFFDKIGKTNSSNTSLIPVFSPEDEVFKPYIYLLDKVCEQIIEEESVEDKFEQAIKEYNDEDYTHSIGTIGILTEDILIQIYETFFRESLPKQQGLGQIIDLLNKNVSLFFKKGNIGLPDIYFLYESIKFLLKNKNIESRDILKLDREIINFVKDSTRYQLNLITKLGNKTTNYNVFPLKLRDNLDELIKYRNSISHKSRIPIDDFESIKSIYACFSLYRWWKNEKKVIDWSDSKEDIIKKVVDRSVVNL